MTRLSVNQPDEPKSKQVARMTLEGIIASDSKLASKFMDGLGQDPHRRISPEKIEPNGRGGANAFNFRQKFTSTVDLEKPRPDKYTGRLPDAPSRDRMDEGDDR